MAVPTALIRFAAGLLAAISAAVVTAVSLAVLDLYLTGHGRPSLLQPVVEWPPLGVSLSVGDMIMLSAAAIGGAVGWHAAGSGGRR